MIIHNPILTGSLTLNNVNLSTGNLVTTGSNTFVGNQILSGSLTVSGSVSATGTLTAQTLVVQTITSSVVYSSGSNVFGNSQANVQVMTGSLLITGSLRVGSSNQQTSGNERIWLGQNSSIGLDDANSLSLSISHAPASGSPQIAFTYQFRQNDNSGANLYGDAVRVVKNAGANTTYTSFFTNSTIGNGTERMRIDANGNVGIGVTPSYALDVANSSSPSLRVRNGALGGTATLLLETANDFSGTCQTYIKGIGTTSNGTSQLAFATAGASGDSTATERMRITSGGKVLTGTTDSSGAALFAAKSSTTATTWSFGPNTVSSLDIFRIETLSTTGVYLTSGQTSWTANSDERLKNIDSNIENAVDILNTLRTVKYSWKKDSTNTLHLGLIAQDVIKVLPEVVDIHEDEDKTLGVRYTELIPVLIKAIQEQQAQIEELKSQINK